LTLGTRHSAAIAGSSSPAAELPWLTLEHGTNDIVSTWGVAEAIICLAEGADLDLRKRLLA
jgi:hypothetical protein